MHIHCCTLVQLFFCNCTAKCGHTWAASLLLVLMQISPPDPLVLSRMTTSPSSVDRTIYRCLHILPMVTIWLGWPRFGCLPEVPDFTHAHIHCYKHKYKHDKAANDNAYKLNHIILILLVRVRRTRWSRTLLLATLLYGRIMVKNFNNFYLAGISVLLFCYIFFCFSQLIIPVKCLQETGWK